MNIKPSATNNLAESFIVQGLMWANLGISIPILWISNLGAQNKVCPKIYNRFYKWNVFLGLECKDNIKLSCFHKQIE